MSLRYCLKRVVSQAFLVWIKFWVATVTDVGAADEKSDKSIGKHSRIMKITKNTIITRREMFL